MLRRSGIEAAFAESDDNTGEPKPDGSNYESKCVGSNDESEYGAGTAELKSDINTDESKSDIIIGESRFVGNTDKSDADICIINTCSVTAEADRKSRQLVRRMIKEHPGASVYVTGCAAQAAPEIFSSIPGVCGVIGLSLIHIYIRKISEIIGTCYINSSRLSFQIPQLFVKRIR